MAQYFVNILHMITKKIYNGFYKFPKKIIFTEEDKKSFESAEICHICERELGEEKVRDHCHFTGKYRGAAIKYAT